VKQRGPGFYQPLKDAERGTDEPLNSAKSDEHTQDTSSEPEFLTPEEEWEAIKAAKNAECEALFTDNKINRTEWHSIIDNLEAEHLAKLRREEEAERVAQGADRNLGSRDEQDGTQRRTEAEPGIKVRDERLGDIELTDAQQARLERRLATLYRDASREITRGSDGPARPDHDHDE
jgi:hypothetical protein